MDSRFPGTLLQPSLHSNSNSQSQSLISLLTFPQNHYREVIDDVAELEDRLKFATLVEKMVEEGDLFSCRVCGVTFQNVSLLLSHSERKVRILLSSPPSASACLIIFWDIFSGRCVTSFSHHLSVAPSRKRSTESITGEKSYTR